MPFAHRRTYKIIKHIGVNVNWNPKFPKHPISHFLTPFGGGNFFDEKIFSHPFGASMNFLMFHRLYTITNCNQKICYNNCTESIF